MKALTFASIAVVIVVCAAHIAALVGGAPGAEKDAASALAAVLSIPGSVAIALISLGVFWASMMFTPSTARSAMAVIAAVAAAVIAGTAVAATVSPATAVLAAAAAITVVAGITAGLCRIGGAWAFSTLFALLATVALILWVKLIGLVIGIACLGLIVIAVIALIHHDEFHGPPFEE